ncbi:unnamed protein product [Onchocerca flexuosa]|uniref:Ovule protein n=1 Tax=Onchocerca flexuosa TaxID=387005 RepID=A0A183HSH6_9BILA|nr:unnamed protein product [Onchocerca flexuosa]
MKKEQDHRLMLKFIGEIHYLQRKNSLLISHSSLQLFTIRRLFHSQDNLAFDPAHNFLCYIIHVVDFWAE